MNGYPLRLAGIRIARTITMTTINNEVSDNQLVSQALDGHPQSFQELVQRYYKKAYQYARGMTGDSDEAYDLSQEAFVRVHKHLKRFDQKFPFKVWFFHILGNLCKNHLRKRAGHNTTSMPSDEMEFEDSKPSARPDIMVQQDEIQKTVWAAINELPENFKEIIILSHFQDFSYDQIAQSLDIPRGSVMSRLYYARIKLREILEKKKVEL